VPNDTGVGKMRNFQPISCCISETVQDMAKVTNRNSHMRFRLVPKSSTLGDLELLYVQIFSEFCASWHVWEATTAKRMKIDPHCQGRNCCALKVLFNDVQITLILLQGPKWGPI